MPWHQRSVITMKKDVREADAHGITAGKMRSISPAGTPKKYSSPKETPCPGTLFLQKIFLVNRNVVFFKKRPKFLRNAVPCSENKMVE